MIPISICVIMKDEEKHMENFLSSIIRHFEGCPYEIVLVDTGSTDRTIEISQRYTDNIYHFQWINDFSAARNFSISCAKNDWILVLDCDEYIIELDSAGLQNILQNMIAQAPNTFGMLTIKNHYEMNGTDSVYTTGLERFFNKNYFHYENTVHEQLLALNGSNASRIAIPLVIDHHGYAGSFEDLCKKAERDAILLDKMLTENPSDAYLYFQLGQSYNMMHDDKKACYYFGKGLEFATDPGAEYVQLMVIGYGHSLLHLGQLSEALLLENIYDDFANLADFVCMMGLIYLRNGLLIKAMAEFIKATTFKTARTEGSNSFIPRYNIGCIYELLKDKNTAIQYYKKCGSFKPAQDRLVELQKTPPNA